MEQSKRRIVIILSVMLVAAVAFFAVKSCKDYREGELKKVRDEAERKKSEKEALKEKTNSGPKIVFATNDDIKKEYGRIETVYLWNGKTYTGAVFTDNNIYRMVTIEGMKTIPIKDVKLREMIK